MPFAATQMDQERVTLSKVRQTKINVIITYMWNLNKKKCANKLNYKKEIESQMQQINLWLPGGKRGGDK